MTSPLNKKSPLKSDKKRSSTRKSKRSSQSIDKPKSAYSEKSKPVGLSMLVYKSSENIFYIDDIANSNITTDINTKFTFINNLIKSNIDKMCGKIGSIYLINLLKKCKQHDSNKICFLLFNENADADKTAAEMHKILNKKKETVLQGAFVGFIIATFMIEDDEKGIYLDIICSEKGYGKYLLNYIENYARNYYYKFIRLESVKEAITYYPKFNYQFRKNCKSDTEIIDLPASLKLVKKTEDEALANLDDFMKTLKEKQMNHNHYYIMNLCL